MHDIKQLQSQINQLLKDIAFVGRLTNLRVSCSFSVSIPNSTKPRAIYDSRSPGVKNSATNRHDSFGQSIALNCETGYRVAARQSAVYSSRRSKWLVSTLGMLEFSCACYYCQCCGHGFFPKDGTLGLTERIMSLGVV